MTTATSSPTEKVKNVSSKMGDVAERTKRKKKKKKKVSAGPESNGTAEAPRKKKKKKKKKSRTREGPTPGERIQSVGRGFRLSFGGLGGELKMGKDLTAKALKDIDVDEDQIRFSKKLYAKHPALTKVSSAKGKLTSFFSTRTLPYPEAAVRLFPMDLQDIDLETATEEDISKAMAKQLDVFTTDVRKLIDEYFVAVKELGSKWTDVLVAAKAKLKDAFRKDDYPEAETLVRRHSVGFDPFNVDLPKEYAHVSPEEHRRATQSLQARFEQAAKLQEIAILKMVDSAIEQMVDSIKGYHDGEQSRFNNSVIDNVFKAVGDFKGKCQKYGILSNTAIEDQFTSLDNLLKSTGGNTAIVSGVVRDSPESREDFIDRATVIRNTIMEQAEKRERRALVRRK
jgi:hypothetical protein